MPVVVDQEVCVGCGACVSVCPVGALELTDEGKAFSNPELCIDCGACMAECPMEAISEQ